MRKEVFFAILAGISIGLIVAFGAWKVRQSVQKIKTPPLVTTKKQDIPKNTPLLSIDNLSDQDVVTENEFKIEGLTTPFSNIVISTTEKDYYSRSDKEGLFEMIINIPTGGSEIKITNIDKELEKKLIVIYSTEVEKGLTSYIGTITDISSGTIQIKTSTGDIKQMSTTDDTKYINTLKKNIEVKITDLAIGDYIISLGKINGSKILKISRILISSPITENKTEIKNGKIESLSKTSIKINPPSGETSDITLPKKWFGPNVKDLEVGQEIIIVGTKTENKFDLRSIFIPVQ